MGAGLSGAFIGLNTSVVVCRDVGAGNGICPFEEYVSVPLDPMDLVASILGFVPALVGAVGAVGFSKE